MKRAIITRWALWLVVALVALPALPVAAADDNIVAPEIEHSIWLAVLLSVGFLGVILAVAFKNARRTHLD